MIGGRKEDVEQGSQYELIRTAHQVYGKSGWAIAYDSSHSRNTVKKALAGQVWQGC
jgi:hypothetical protein